MSRDSARILDIIHAAQDVLELTRGMSAESFQADYRTELAIARLFQIIGEAARRVSEETKSANPAIPWPRIVGLRHRLVHEYDQVDYDLIWIIIENELPTLIKQLEPLVPPPK